MDRRLRYFSSQITSSSPPIGITPISAIAPFTTVGPRAPAAFDELAVKLEDGEKRLVGINQSWETLGRRQRELEEARCVLRETASFFNQVRSMLGVVMTVVA